MGAFKFVSFGSCSRCGQDKKLPFYAKGKVSPICGCPEHEDGTPLSLEEMIEQAVEEVTIEFGGEDVRDVSVHLVTCAAAVGMSLVKDDRDTRLKALIRCAAMCYMLLTETEEVTVDEDDEEE